MPCDLASVKLDSYFDGELPAGEQAAVARHVAGCAACAEALGQMQTLRGALAAEFAGVVPSDLEASVKRALQRETGLAGDLQRVPLRQRFSSPWAMGLGRAAAVFILVAGVSAGVTYDWVARHAPVDQITHDIVAAHARAMMEAMPYQVASSDQHTVKPWFAGRTEFSPEVRDFADRGYALVGGRLDYVNGQRVAALVYKHGAHFIDVFMWPNAGPEADPSYSTSGGYQLASWVNGGIEGRCISDIGPAEMKVFASLLYGKEG